MRSLSVVLSTWLCLLASPACRSASAPETLGRSPGTGPDASAIAVPASTGALTSLEANWKERLAQPYVYVEHQGDYRRVGDAMRALFRLAQELELETGSGAPFALFFDDPGRVPVGELRARACLPVRQQPGSLGELRYDVLPRAMVVYARVPGPYPEVPRSYPALFAYLRTLGWQPGGPVREIYLVDPESVSGYDELLTEVQIPWTAQAQPGAR